MAKQKLSSTLNKKPHFEDIFPLNLSERKRRLLELAKAKELSKVSAEYLTSEYLTVMLPGEAKTALHHAAASDDILWVPSSTLTLENLMLRDYDGNSVCDILYLHKWFRFIPQSYYTYENLVIKEGKPCNKLQFLVESDGLSHLPKNLYSKALLKLQMGDRNFLELACFYTALDSFPPDLLTEEILNRRYNEDYTALVFAVQHGNLEVIPSEVLTDSKVSEEDKARILYSATIYGELDLLPGGFINKTLIKLIIDRGGEILAEQNCLAEMLYHAFTHDQINLLPAEILHIPYALWRTVEGRSVLFAAVSSDTVNLIDPQLITSESLKFFENPKRYSFDTVLHRFAFQGLMSFIPDGVYGRCELEIINENSESVFHAAAYSGSLNQIEDFLYVECLTERNQIHCEYDSRLIGKWSHGFTPTHILAWNGELNQIPKHLRIAEVILCRDEKGETIFDYASFFGTTEKIPRDMLVYDFISEQNGNGECAWQVFATKGLGFALKLLPAGSMKLEWLPEMAEIALESDNIDLGRDKDWVRHFRDVPICEMTQLVGQLPEQLQEGYELKLAVIREIHCMRNQLADALSL